MCGETMEPRALQQLGEDASRLRYLVGEVTTWGQLGIVEPELRERLLEPYQLQLKIAESYLHAAHEALAAQQDAERAVVADRAAEPVADRDPDAVSDPDAVPGFAPSAELVPAAAFQPEPTLAAPEAPRGDELQAMSAPRTVEATFGFPAAPADPPAFAHAEAARHPEPFRAPAPPPEPGAGSRLVQEVRPVLYENFILFLGAFLIFAGSIYFATYFWERLGSFGPLVAGSLLALYASSFAGMGYLLQRRYRAELSARVLFGIATAIYPVAATLCGAPLRTGSGGIALLSGGAVLLWAAAAYPAITIAASLFQREIARPFTRAFTALLLIIGLAPLLMRVAPREAGLVLLYLSALPLLAMYRRLREVGRIFEPETVIYVVGASAYLLFAVAVRLALLLVPTLSPAEVAPLIVLLATAAVDLDVEWRVRRAAQMPEVRSALGLVSILAQGAAVIAVVLAFPHPLWRALTTFGVAALFAVTALRHRRPYALHLALATAVLALFLVPPMISAMAMMAPTAPRRWMALSGLLLLPWSLVLGRLAARWRRHAAPEFAAPVELWILLGVLVAAVATALPAPSWLGADWQPLPGYAFSAHLAALVVLPAAAACLAVTWSWLRRSAHLTAAACLACATAIVLVNLAGLPEAWLAAPAAALAAALALAALLTSAQDARRAVQHAALVLVAGALLALAGTRDLAGTPQLAQLAALTLALLAAAALALAAALPPLPGRIASAFAVAAAPIAIGLALSPYLPDGALIGVLTLALLALDRLATGARLGQAQPLRDVYTLALCCLGLHIFHLLSAIPDLTGASVLTSSAPPISAVFATVSPLDPALIAAAFLWMAARHRSAWPTYAAFGFLLAAAFATPAALSLDMSAAGAAKTAGLALVFASLVLVIASRWSPRLRAWRPIFLDIPLHLAAIAAPLSAYRFFETAASWSEHHDAVRLLRRLAQPLALSLLATYTHGARFHAYLSAALVAVVPPVIAWMLVPDASSLTTAQHLSLVIAVTALAGWGGALALLRFERFAAPLGAPMRLLGLFALPSAPTPRELWRGPLQLISAATAAAAFCFALFCSAELWPLGSRQIALTYALVTAYALLRWHFREAHRFLVRLAAHLACAAFAFTCLELSNLTAWSPGGRGLLLLGALYLVISEAFATFGNLAGDISSSGAPSARARAAAHTSGEWAIAMLVLALVSILPSIVSVVPGDAPLAALLLAAAVVRYGRHRPALPMAAFFASLSTMLAAALSVAWLLSLVGWFDPGGITLAACAVLAVAGGAFHYFARGVLPLPGTRPLRYASNWAIFAAVLAFASIGPSVPEGAPSWLPNALSLLALAGVAAWFAFTTQRAERPQHGQLIWLALLAMYFRVRLSHAPIGPFGLIGADLSATTDAIVLVALAFALHLAAELLQRVQLTALERAARSGAAVIPLIAGALGLWSWLDGDGTMTTLRVALLAESLGVLYTLAMRNGGPRAFGLLAIFLYNIGLALLWMHSGRRDPLYYTLPAGASVFLIARIYRQNLEGGARRGLHFAGALVIYFSTYYRVVQFDSGFYPLLLGGLTLAGLAAGFFLQLRDLFLISAGFIVLNVISNLTYYGVHRPLLGWTLLTLAGLGLTAAGVLFQLRRTQLRELLARVRTQLGTWE